MNNEHDIQHVEVTAVSSNALEAQERATIDIQIATAKKYPRSLDKFKKDATSMIQASKAVAESCVYNRPVGKDSKTGRMKFAEGASIRLAEIVGSCYCNLRVATVITEVTPRQVKAQGVAFDLEKNYAVKKDCMETTVTKSGKPFSERMRIVVAKACQSKALRDAVFGVIPRALCNDLIEIAKDTVLGGRTLDELVPGVVSWVKTLDIDAKRVWGVLGVGGPTELTMDHVMTLAGLKTAIADSEITVNEVFPPSVEEQKANDPAQKIKDHFAGKGKKEEPAPAPAKKPKKADPKKPKKTAKKTSSPQESPTPAVDQPAQEEPVPLEHVLDISPTEPEEVHTHKCKRCDRTGTTDKCAYCMGECVPI